MSARPARAWIDLGLLTLCWASGFTFTAMALDGFSPEWVVVFRQLAATMLLVPVVLALSRVRAVPRALWGWLIALATLGNVAPFYVISWGQQHIASGVASILVTTMPLMTLALAHFFIAGERMTRRRLLGFATGFAGVVLIVGPEALGRMGGGGLALAAQLAVLLGAVFFAANAIVARLMPEMDIWMRSAMVNGLALIIALPPAALMAPLPASFPGWGPVAGVVCTGIFASAVATVIYFRLIDEAGPTFMSLTNYMVPPVALLAGIVVLAERPDPEALGGLALILAGMAIAEWRTRTA